MKHLFKVKDFGEEERVPLTSEQIKRSKKKDLIEVCAKNRLSKRGTKKLLQGMLSPSSCIYVHIHSIFYSAHSETRTER